MKQATSTRAARSCVPQVGPFAGGWPLDRPLQDAGASPRLLSRPALAASTAAGQAAGRSVPPRGRSAFRRPLAQCCRERARVWGVALARAARASTMPVRAASGAPAGGEAAGRAESRRGSARSAFLRTALLLLAASALALGGDAVVHAPPPPVRRLAHARAVRRPLNRTHSTLSKSSLIGYDAQAKCTDGSPAYVFSAMFKTPAMAATWVMYLPATYMCWDAASCAKLQFWCAAVGSPRAACTRCGPRAPAGGLTHPAGAGTPTCSRPASFPRPNT